MPTPGTGRLTGTGRPLRQGPMAAPPSAPAMRLGSHHTLTVRLITPLIAADPATLRRRAGRAGCAPIVRRPLSQTCRRFRSSGRRGRRQHALRSPTTMVSTDRRHASSQHDMHANSGRRRTDSIHRTTTNITSATYELDDGSSPGNAVTTTGIGREETFIAAGSLPSTEST